MNKTIQASIASAAALGLTSLAWIVTKDKIISLKSRALIYETAAARTPNPANKVLFREISDELQRRADFAETLQSLNPWTYLVHYAKIFYNSYLGKGRKESEVY